MANYCDNKKKIVTMKKDIVIKKIVMMEKDCGDKKRS